MMDKEKQTEELGEEIFKHCSAGLFEEEANAIADFVINKQGFRKASEVASEIIDEIIHYTDANKAFIAPIPMNELLKFGLFLGELEKKYTEEEE